MTTAGTEGAAMLSQIIEQISDYAIFLLDEHGHITSWNAGAQRIKGYEAHEVIGTSLSRFYPAEAFADFERALDVARREGRYESEGWRVRKDGTRFWANGVLTALRDESGRTLGFAKVTRDLTERRRAEEARVRLAEEAVARREAERRVELLAELQRLLGLVAAARTPAEVARILVADGARAIGAQTALLVVSEPGKNLDVVAAHDAPDTLVAGLRSLGIDARVPVAAALRTHEAQWLASPAEHAAGAPDFPSSVPRPESVAVLPLLVGGPRRLALAYLFAEPRTFEPEDRARMRTFAAEAALAIDRAEAEENEREARRRVEALGSLSAALSNALATEEVARVVADAGVAAARADTCTLYVHEESSGDLELIAERGVSPQVIELIRRIPASSDRAVAKTFASRESVWSETPEEYVAFDAKLATLEAEGRRARAFWSVPLIVEGRPIGLLGMGFYEPRRFPPEERAFTMTFAQYCGEALLRARRLDRERAAWLLVAAAQASLTTTLRSIGDAVITTNPAGAVTMMNAVAERLTGWREAEARGRLLTEVFRIVNEHTRATVPNPVDQVLERGVVVGLANHTVLIARDGRDVPIDDSGAPIRRDGGPIEGVVLVFRDVTAQKRDESRRALMLQAVSTLAESLDYEAILAKLAALVVPRLADWCAIDVLEEGADTPKRVAVAHVDPAKVAFAKTLGPQPRPPHPAERGLWRVIDSGRAELYPEVPETALKAAAQGDERLRAAAALGVRSAMIVPLAARGDVLGAMTLAWADTDNRYGEDDLRFAEDLASRCAFAIENARLYASEQEARKAADIASRAKDEFLAMVSHELRTPLNAMLGWSKILSTTKLDETRHRQGLQAIVRNSETMARLIDDLLDLTRIASGKLQLSVENVDLGAVAAAAIEMVRPVAEDKGVVLSTELGKSAQPFAGDSLRLQQVIGNILNNAVKFTPKGGRVHTELRWQGSSAELRISDTGKGISAEFLPYVFEAFRQEQSSPGRGQPGLGLGLAITRKLVELHGGRIEAQSEGEGKGALFVVHLPAKAASL